MSASEPKRSVSLDAFLLELEVHALSATRGTWDFARVGERTAAVHALRPDQPFPSIATDLSRRDATYVLAAQPENIVALVKITRQLRKLLDMTSPMFGLCGSMPGLSEDLRALVRDLDDQVQAALAVAIEVAP